MSIRQDVPINGMRSIQCIVHGRNMYRIARSDERHSGHTVSDEVQY